MWGFGVVWGLNGGVRQPQAEKRQKSASEQNDCSAQTMLVRVELRSARVGGLSQLRSGCKVG